MKPGQEARDQGAELEALDLVVEHPSSAGVFRALDCPELRIAAGSSVAIMGPSGCGKSTLLGVLAGLSMPTAGTITIAGTVITSSTEASRVAFRREMLGMVYQADNLLPFLTVTENVRLQLALCNDVQDAQARVSEILERLGLAELGHRLPDELSGGQRQRVAVARAIVHRPRLILADEPTGALDEDNADLVIELLTDVGRDLGATLVLVTHDPRVANHLQRLVTLNAGVIVDDREIIHAG